MMTRLTSFLCLLALCLASAIPQGWMPVRGAQGELIFVICTGDGPVEMVLDRDGDAPGPADSEPTPCKFSGPGAAALVAVAGEADALQGSM